MKIRLTACLAVAALAWSCSTPKDVTYIQDIQQGTVSAPSYDASVKARPDDKLQITVSTKDEALTKLFNVTPPTLSSSNIIYYTVDSQGDIDFPILGRVHVGGLTRQGIANEIKDQLISRNLVKDATVLVDFGNPMINVIGEVKSPGRYNMDRDRISVLDALAMAGDLTINGERKNVAVIRNNPNGQSDIYRIDLTSVESIYGSPAYYLQQNDVVYVEPNDTRKRQRSVNGNSVLTPSFWISIVSVLTTIAVLVWK